MKKIIITILTITTLFACKNDIEAPVVNTDFFESYYTDNIQPSLANFTQELKTQEALIQKFEASKNDADFDKMLSQWLVCAKAFSKIEVYNFGLIKDKFYNINLYNYPANITKVESNIASKVIYDSNFFASQSTSNKGLATIEYLLYGNQNITEAKSLLINDNYRLDYLLGVSKELIRVSEAIKNTWKNEYKDTFINLNGNICTQSAKCLSINQIINVLDVAKVTKIGKPAGFEKSNNIAPTTLQAYRSKTSLKLIEATLNEIKYAYFDSKTNYASLVDAIDDSKKISAEIAKKINNLELEISKLNNNLFDEISDNTENVQPIYNGLKELSILFAVDVTSILSVAVLPTDNDGD
ncbi:MAG: imelysin family protein [Tenacibaculum sp.]